MRQLPSDKYNVAWFKLAEFVSRGERERALCLYKLLVHSFDDYALAAQLEGDILLAFNDTYAACQSYRNAAGLYIEKKRFIEAVAVYEQILMLDNKSQEDRLNIILLYDQLMITTRLIIHIEQLCCSFVQNNQIDTLEKLLQDWDTKLTDVDRAHLYKIVTIALIKNKSDSTTIRLFLKKSVNHLLLCKNDSFLQTFLSTLEALHEDYYFDATELIYEL